MYKFFQKYSKQILAVFSVGLMIVFIIPSTRQQFAGQPNAVVGTIGDDKLYQRESRQAKMEWDALKSIPSQRNPRYPLVVDVLGVPAYQQINAHPEAFLLLKKEAQRAGAGVTADQIESFITNNLGDLTGLEEDRQANMRQAVHALLLVDASYQRARSVIKISSPLRKHSLAQRTQEIALNLVEIDAKTVADKTPAPTTQAVQEQFDRFADKLPGEFDQRTNPFGFGYRYPNRVKVQFIGIPRAEVQKIVEASKTPFEWEVAARKYYYEHPSEFATTQPTTASTQSATTAPSIRSFDQAKDDARNRILNPEVTRKMDAIQQRIASALGADWSTYHNAIAAGATRPTTAPASTMGVPYDSFEYLQKLAAAVQAEFKVLPTILDTGNAFKTAKDLRELPGIGTASIEMLSFADFATNFAKVFNPPTDQRLPVNPFEVMEPSPPLRNLMSDIYFFRLVDASPAHKPKSIDEVAAKVKADALAVAQYEQAKLLALQIESAAAKTSLAQAAGDRRVISTRFFKYSADDDVPGYPIPPEIRPLFIVQAFELVSTPATQPSGKRMKIIELQAAGKAIIAELADVRTENQLDSNLLAGIIAHQMTGQYEGQFQSQWYDFKNLVSRLKYQPAERKSDS